MHEAFNNPEAFAAQYRNAEPYPHIVLDNLFPQDVLEQILAEFPKPGEVDWQKFDSPTEKKLGFKIDNKIGTTTRNFLWYLNSAEVLNFLERLTGIPALIPDPYYHGGGLHQMERGGLLKIHADFNWHKKLEIHRRINLLIYLNKDWKDEYGGHLEMWDRDMTACRNKVLPLFGRVVIFNTTDQANHGLPDPLQCPEGTSRKSLALYYYTSRPAEGEQESVTAHGTLFRRRDAKEWSSLGIKSRAVARTLRRWAGKLVGR